MKIKNLLIENFKAISKLELKSLGDFIIIAGPNGSGKSTMMEAVKFFKSCYGGYQQGEFTNLLNALGMTQNSQIDPTTLFHNPAKPLKIELDIELNKEEIKFCEQSLDMLKSNFNFVNSNRQQTHLETIRINENERVECLKSITDGILSGKVYTENGRLDKTPNSLLSWIFSLYSPESLGTFDFNDAFRSYQRQTLNNVSLSTAQTTDNIKNSAVVNTNNKHNNIKNIVANSFIKSKLDMETKDVDFINDAIVKLFELFFPNKQYSGPSADKDGVKLLIKTGESTHDIDFLSSGEKEMVMGYLWLLCMNFNHSIFFIDEPELHLNPKLAKKIPLFYKEFVGTQFKSQVWLITHSDAIIDTALKDNEYSIYHLKHPNNDTINQIEKIESGNMSLFFELVGDVAQFYPDNKTVFLEGKNSEVDRDIIETLFDEYEDKINFISVGDKKNVKDISKTVKALNSTPRFKDKFHGICDKDFDDNRLLDENCHCWDVYHIENYLLNFEILKEVLHTSSLNGTEQPDSAFIKDTTLEIAKELTPKYTLEKVKRIISDRIKGEIKLGVNPESENIVEELGNKLNICKESISALGIENIQEQWGEISLAYSKMDEGQIIANIPAREILRKLAGMVSPQLGYDAFRQQIINTMRMKAIKPEGIKKVLDEIVAT